MPDATITTRFRFWLWLIRLIGVIVPRRLRADWRQEWEAELRHREMMLAEWDRLTWHNKLDLLWRSTSAFWDAMWLQPKRLEDEIFQDVRYGVRMLVKSPAFTLAAMLSLAIGIGANTALFSIVNAVLWRPLPYPAAERLVRVGEWSTAAEFVALGEAPHVFDGLAGWMSRDFTLTGRGAPANLKGQLVTSELLPLLGVTPRTGRGFIAEEFQPGSEAVALISDRLWRSRFGGDPQLIGQALTLDQRMYVVVGVMPPQFDFFPAADLLTPLAITAEDLRQENYYNIGIVGRLSPGMTLEVAQKGLAGLARSFESPDAGRLQPLRDLLIKDFRLTLLVLWGVVGFVLLIACANVANLMLARAANRQKELAIRAALGARRARLVRQLLTESLLVASIGGAMGLVCAYFSLQVLSAANPTILPRLSESTGLATIPRLGEVTVNGWVMAFNLGLTLLTGVLFGLAPALQFTQTDLNHALKEGAAVSARGFRFGVRRGTQSVLVIGEVALALVLLVGAGLLIRSLARLQQIETGFQPDGLLTLHLEFPSYKYREDAHVTAFVTQLGERLAVLPGVEGVSVADSLPLGVIGSFSSMMIEGKPNLTAKLDDLPFGMAPPPLPSGSTDSPLIGPSAFFSTISPNYFTTLGIPLRQGRQFAEHDNRRSLPVAIVNEAMARRYWPEEDPLGKRLKSAGSEAWRTVVGVVGNVKRFALEDEPTPEFYVPLLQPFASINDEPETPASGRKKTKAPAKTGKIEEQDNNTELASFTTIVRPTANQRFSSHISLMVRTIGRPETAAESVRQTVWDLDSEQPILQLSTMQARLDEVYAPRRFNSLLFGVFALVALLLAAVGIYGVLAYMVAQRTHEIGIRRALGAQTHDVLWLIVRQGLVLTLIGVALGLVAALALTRVMQNLLFGVSATDPITFTGVSLTLITIAFLASFIPARRATRVDPLTALRHE